MKRSAVIPAAGPTTRPKAWQQLWLDRHREVLLVRLQSIVMRIVDRLVQEDHMDPSLDETYQMISSAHALPVEKARRLLDYLRASSEATFKLFQCALAENGCEDLAVKEDDVKEMEAAVNDIPAFERRSLELGVPASVVKARRMLCSLYTEAASEVHMLADVYRSSDGSARDLGDVFVNIGLASSDEVEKLCSEWTGRDGGVDEVLARALQAKKVELCDVLTAERGGGKDPVRVVAVGTAGSGKSFAFTLKATHDWCGGEFWEDIALLRTIQCRDKSVWQAKSITELFQIEELGLSSAEEAEVKAFIAQNPGRVGLVCDGLDEGCVDEGSFLWRVMAGKSLRGLCVIITSRPCTAVRHLSQSGAIHRHLQMSGFSRENVDVFVRKYLGDQRGKEMLSLLAEHPSVVSLMHTPFFAVLICEQFDKKGQLPQSRTSLFSNMALRMVQRCAKSRGMKDSFRSLEKAPGELYEQVLELGKVAFERLKRKDLSYFELDDEDLSPEAVHLGFLEHVQASSSAAADKYGFRHLTVQEYLAALHASVKVLRTPEDVVMLAGQLGCGEDAGYLNTFWVFVAGSLDSNLREALLCAIAETDMETVARSMRSSDDTNSESVECGDASAVSNSKTGSRGLPGKEESVSSQSLVDSQGGFLGQYRFFLLLRCCLEVVENCAGHLSRSACVAYVLKKQGWNLRGPIFPSNMRLLFDVAEKYSEVIERVNVDWDNLQVPYDEGRNMLRLMSAFCSCTNLKEFRLFQYEPLTSLFCGKQRQNVFSAIGKVLARQCQSLERVHLVMPPVEDEDFRRLSGGLDQAQHLKSLDVSIISDDYGLLHEHRDATDLAAALSGKPALEELCLHNNEMGDAGFAHCVGPALQTCTRMSKLDLANIGLTCDSRSMLALAAVLVCMPQLSELRLVGNKIQDEGFLQVAPAVQRCCLLRSLSLNHCQLASSGSSMPLLASLLLCLPQLEILDISGNDIGTVGLDQLSIGLEECHRLSVLSLDYTSGASKSFGTISRLLNRLPGLKTVSLAAFGAMPVGTSARDGERQLIRAVQQHQSLQRLNLPARCSDAMKKVIHGLAHDPAHPLQRVFPAQPK